MERRLTRQPTRSNSGRRHSGRVALVDDLAAIVGEHHVRHRASELLVYESDGLPGYHKRPRLAVFPATRDELVAVVKALAAAGEPFVPRGAGTGLSGGALADDVVLLGLNRLTRILSIDPANRTARVEPGVVNVALSRATAAVGLFYAPDPSSQAACTIGGNVAENAGGPHCLKYGVTLNHVLAATVILPDGEIVQLGDAGYEQEGYDLLGAFVGSEGCFGVALEVTVRLLPLPPAVRTLLADFRTIVDAARATSAIVASGIVPAALEMMDGGTIRAVEASIYAAGYPVDAEAILLIEVDGLEDGLDVDANRITELCLAHGARTVRRAADQDERARLWQGRKKAFGAMGRISPHLVVQDAVIPRTRLPDVLATIQEIAVRHGVHVCNVFHAGDGNLHPNIGYDANDPDERARVHEAMHEMMHACVAVGGSVTGEHGVGLDKLDHMESVFSPDSLDAMCQLRSVFDPDRRANPGKVVPVHSCREWRGATGARGGGGAVPMTHAPTSVDAVREIVLDHAGRRAPLRIVGRGTWLDAGRPVADATPLDLSGLSGVVEYTPGDLTLTARAGTSLRTLTALTHANAQFLPLDPWGGDAGSLGATIATATAGPRAGGGGGGRGLPRDVVLGVEFVDGRGRVARGGGRVVKNVAGFDLVRLQTGAWGTLGVLTEVSVRLNALPERDETVALDPGANETRFDATLASLRNRAWSAVACEIVNGPLARRLELGSDAVVLLRLAGNDAAVRAMRATAAELGDTRDVPAAAWDALRASDAGANVVVRVSAPATALGDTWRRAMRMAGATGEAHASVARGVVRCMLGDIDARAIRAAFDGVEIGCVFERLPAARWRDGITAPAPASGRLGAGLLQAFDPDGVLNPGILASGLA